MTKTSLLCLGALMMAGACTDPDRFSNADQGTSTLGSSSGAQLGANTGGVSNSNSPEYFSQTVGDRVFFEVDSATLTANGQATLAAQTAWLMRNQDYQIIIEGHADEKGTREYNLALGARRANAAREFLISKGISLNRLKTVSYGKERPVELCAQEACYGKNRRAVSIISVGSLS